MDTKATFRFATDIIRRLGEELNPSVDQSILELVKNSYDADATICRIVLDQADRAGGSVLIEDNGAGMSEAAILNGWLVLGSSSKQKSDLTRGGRTPAGSKGLGRLAALRMGHRAELVSRPEGTTETFGVTLDWDAFDRSALVDDVPISVKSADVARQEHGTTLLLADLREGVTRTDVKRLARSLILLADPFGEDRSGFRPVLEAPEFDDLAEKVKQRYFKDADYHLVATLDGGGWASARVLDWKGEGLFSASHAQLRPTKQDQPYQAGSAQFDFWAFLLSKQSFLGRNATIQEVRAWLESVGGVHVYENGLRVAPYGNPGNDWLDINLRRAQNPEERPSTNNSIGRLAVTDTIGLLVQKTDRSGFIESESFLQLRAFAQDALEWMARRRMEVAEKRRRAERESTPKVTKTAKLTIEEAISLAPQENKQAIQQAFTTFEKATEREIETLRREVQLYRTLSTAGITAATFAHESTGSPLKVIANSIDTIERRVKTSLKERYTLDFEPPINRIKRAVDGLGVLSATTLSLIDQDKRRVARLDINKVIAGIVSMLNPFFIARDVDVQCHFAPGDPYMRGSTAALESIVTNLINNSLAAFESAGSHKRQIAITTREKAESLFLTISDNGPGIKDIDLGDIWSPGTTTRLHGTGLGLTIVKDAISDLGGAIVASEHGPLGGAMFDIRLPILGS